MKKLIALIAALVILIAAVIIIFAARSAGSREQIAESTSQVTASGSVSSPESTAPAGTERETETIRLPSAAPSEYYGDGEMEAVE